MAQQLRPYALPLNGRRNISMAHQRDLSLVLYPHDAGELSFVVRHPEDDARADLAQQLVLRHVGLVPPIGRNHSPIGLGSGIDNREHRVAIGLRGLSNEHYWMI